MDRRARLPEGCGSTSLALTLWYQDCNAFMIVNSLCKIFVSIFVFKDYRSRVFLFKIFNYLGPFNHLRLFSLPFSEDRRGGKTRAHRPSAPPAHPPAPHSEAGAQACWGSGLAQHCGVRPRLQGWGHFPPPPSAFPFLSLLGVGALKVQNSTKLPNQEVGPCQFQFLPCSMMDCKGTSL